MATMSRGAPPDLTPWKGRQEPTGPGIVAARRLTPRVPPPGSIADRLFKEGYHFHFFQAVRLLQRLDPARLPVGRIGPPNHEIVRFRALLSLSFPPSQLYGVEPATSTGLPATMTVAFMGLTGPSGILPQHYTELLLRLLKEAKGPEKTALRDWLDLFNHRLLSLFYRAWEKYRFHLPFGRQEHLLEQPDTFTQAMRSLVGLGTAGLRDRLKIAHWETDELPGRERVLTRIDDLSLIYLGGLLSRPRSAVNLQALLEEYFQMPVHVQQFVGEWLQLGRDSQSSLTVGLGNNALGFSTVAGERVWDVMGRIRIRIGPLSYRSFNDFIPDRSPTPAQKAFFLLVHLVRLFVGAERSFDVQVILRAAEVPECCLTDAEEDGPRLGWNTWVRTHEAERDAADAVLEGNEITWINEAERLRA
jgi:type VI secretion system protein ImpH